MERPACHTDRHYRVVTVPLHHSGLNLQFRFVQRPSCDDGECEPDCSWHFKTSGGFLLHSVDFFHFQVTHRDSSQNLCFCTTFTDGGDEVKWGLGVEALCLSDWGSPEIQTTFPDQLLCNTWSRCPWWWWWWCLRWWRWQSWQMKWGQWTIKVMLWRGLIIGGHQG